MNYLRAGNYVRGLEMFEQREGRQALPPRLQLSSPEWRGEPLDGKSILVWGEQGLGDEIQMARFIPTLRHAGAERIVLACQEANVRALQHLGADIVLNRHGGALTFKRCDYYVGMFSLPYLLGVRLHNLSGAPYLPRLGRPSGKVGLVWRGAPGNPYDSRRSLPSPDLLRDIPNGVFLEPQGDMLDSIKQLSELDALVTVCTSWAHLAGAIGLPTYVMLCDDADWRWGQSDRTPWYDSARLFRQITRGEWAPVIAAVSEALWGLEDSH